MVRCARREPVLGAAGQPREARGPGQIHEARDAIRPPRFECCSDRACMRARTRCRTALLQRQCARESEVCCQCCRQGARERALSAHGVQYSYSRPQARAAAADNCGARTTENERDAGADAPVRW